MNKFLLPVLGLGLAVVLSGCDKLGMSEPKTDEEKFSYVIGMQIGRSLKQMEDNTGVEVDMEVVRRGVRDVMKDGGKPLMTPEQEREFMTAFSQTMQQKQEEKQKAAAGGNLEAAKKFFAENGKKEGVKTTPSGLQYQVITEGKGDKPKATDRVSVHYTGTLLDGTVFDSSVERGQPATFPLNAVIPGWTEGVQLMTVGSKYKLFIPPELGYGERGAGPKIGPNAALVFEVELLKVEK